MTTMIAEAEVLANYDDRLRGIERQLDRVQGRLTLLTWQFGLISAVLVVVGLPSLWLLIRVAVKIGALPG